MSGIPSFPRRRECILFYTFQIKINMDSRLRGNDVAIGEDENA